MSIWRLHRQRKLSYAILHHGCRTGQIWPSRHHEMSRLITVLGMYRDRVDLQILRIKYAATERRRELGSHYPPLLNLLFIIDTTRTGPSSAHNPFTALSFMAQVGQNPFLGCGYIHGSSLVFAKSFSRPVLPLVHLHVKTNSPRTLLSNLEYLNLVRPEGTSSFTSRLFGFQSRLPIPRIICQIYYPFHLHH